MNRLLAFLLIAVFPAAVFAREPQISSVFPLGGTRGTTFQAEIQGQNLEGTHAIWFDCQDLKATVKGVEPVPEMVKEGEAVKDKKEEQKQERVLIEVHVGRDALIGAHVLRLVTPGGVSGPLAFQVNSEPTVTEEPGPHGTADTAQPISFPVVVNGRVSEKGEVDYYTFAASQGQELRFEVITGSGLLLTAFGAFRNPHLFLYEPTGSWFDSSRLTRLECQDESLFFTFPPQTYVAHFAPRMAHHFDKSGNFIVEVSAFHGEGGSAYTYQLRIVPVGTSAGSHEEEWTPRVIAHQEKLDWQDRSFARKLEPDRLPQLWARSVHVTKSDPKAADKSAAMAAAGAEKPADPTGNAEAPKAEKLASPEKSVPLPSLLEHEPNDTAGQALVVSIPSVIEGKIQRPGDVDFFRFHVKSGESLAFEVETPKVTYPYFSPHLEVSNVAGEELLTNLYRVVAGDGDDWVKFLEPKTTFKFEQAGEYVLRIRDLTTRFGQPDFDYRVLIRPTIPHMGRIVPKTFGIVGIENEVDHLNLVPGEAKELPVISEHEEGFAGEIALSVEGLPEGVQVFPAAAISREVPSQGGQVYEMRGAIHKERFRPHRLLTNLMFIASSEAPVSKMPSFVRLTARPILQGKLGAMIPVYEIPVMVVPRPEKPAEGMSAK